tara:strand:+ start:939 stop:1475 length:537 start_codon:yes stop_codon:yes gene_type:complete
MNPRLIYFLPIIIFLLMIFIFYYFLFIKRDPSIIPSVLINKEAPKFEYLSLINNNRVIFEKELGKEIVIVNFFASWCVPCKIEHEYIAKLSHKKNIKIIGINYKDNPNNALQWLKELGNPYADVAIDTNGEIGIDWGLSGIPETFIVNKNKKIKYKHIGPITKKTYIDFEKIILENIK